jgi:hypothetical protein
MVEFDTAITDVNNTDSRETMELKKSNRRFEILDKRRVLTVISTN